MFDFGLFKNEMKEIDWLIVEHKDVEVKIKNNSVTSVGFNFQLKKKTFQLVQL